MKITGPQIVSQLREKLQSDVGRHLYGVLATYARLKQFEQVDLAQARDPQGRPLPPAVNLNRELLERIGDEDLQKLTSEEARRPKAVQWQLNQELENLIKQALRERPILILKQFELVFALQLELSVLRTSATNQNHILLLLPGTRMGQTITLFHEAEPRFHRTFSNSLIADNHLWELTDAPNH